MEKSIDIFLYIVFAFVAFLFLMCFALLLFKVILTVVKHWNDEDFWE